MKETPAGPEDERIVSVYQLTMMKSKDMTPTVLAIAGSDPTGGAGIQADIRTMAGIGVYGAAAVTCITVQNSRGVRKIVPLAADLVTDQVRAVLADHHVSHIKIGMVGTREIGAALGRLLADFAGEVIFDPVLAATTGEPLTDRAGLAMIRRSLLARTTVLTPNLPELALLAGGPDNNTPEVLARELLARYPRLLAVLVKGGHGAGRSLTDLLVRRQGRLLAEHHPRMATVNTHGTGCILSSAFAAFRSRGMDEAGAFRASVDYLQRLLAENSDRRIVRSPGGHGPLFHDPAAGPPHPADDT